MDKVGILVVSKCLSSAAIVDTLKRSEKYLPEFYIIEKQSNPFNTARAKFHAVVPALSLGDIVAIARRFRDRIAFGLTDTEDFVVAGGRDAVEREAGVQMVCVSKKYAVERSKADQRLLFEAIFKEANPNYRIFDPKKYKDTQEALKDFRKAAAEMNRVVIKPDAPARGAGVGVWGNDFESQREMSAFFLNVLSKGRVVVEEKVEGEESSFHAISDGKHFVPVPLTRDYKRSLEGNKGRLTGGMGSYRAPTDYLPFLTEAEWQHLTRAEEAAFRRWKGRGSDSGLRGVVLYDAIMHTGRGFNVLERNSRGGNTEFINLLTTIGEDFVEVCFRILEGSLRSIRFRPMASVVTCAVPQSYGTDRPPSAGVQQLDLAEADRMSAQSGGMVRVFPMDVSVQEGVCRIGTSRSVAAVGVGPDIAEARKHSLKAVRSLVGPLRWRSDVASASDIRMSSNRLSRLRLSA